MAHALLIQDETILGKRHHSLVLNFLAETITVQELIRSRIYREVSDYNEQLSDFYYGLVKPVDAEETLNGYKINQPKKIDWEKQYEKAIAAFLGNSFILLIDDRQVDTLESVITLHPEMSATFLKLVPLVGG
jgi:hypothetical protein